MAQTNTMLDNKEKESLDSTQCPNSFKSTNVAEQTQSDNCRGLKRSSSSETDGSNGTRSKKTKIDVCSSLEVLPKTSEDDHREVDQSDDALAAVNNEAEHNDDLENNDQGIELLENNAVSESNTTGSRPSHDVPDTDDLHKTSSEDDVADNDSAEIDQINCSSSDSDSTEYQDVGVQTSE